MIIHNRPILLLIALYLCVTVTTSLTVGVRHILPSDRHISFPFLSVQSIYSATSSSLSSTSGDPGSLLRDEIINIDNERVESVILSFGDWYSTALQTDSTNPTLVALLGDDVRWSDFHYTYQPILGNDAVERHLRLQKLNLLGTRNAAISMVIDEVVISSRDNDAGTIAVGFTFHFAERTNGSSEGMAVPNRRGIVVVDLKRNRDHQYRIVAANIMREKSTKSGEFSLRILSLASLFFSRMSQQQLEAAANNKQVADGRKLTLAERYFDAWNRRDMETAATLFTDDISYDDTAFPQPFVGKENLRRHLLKCAQCFPETFTFSVDRVLLQQTDASKMIVTWHVENDNQPLPFTNGISYYEINRLTETISKGIDYVDSESIKMASIIDPMIALYQHEPIRLVPTIVWFAYMYVVFVSDGILPGANAFQLEIRTWEEVRDLSINFFLVAPALQLPFSPSIHPMLEGVFNLLLSWAAMFAGFLSDDRRTKPNLLPMLPIVIGMQFLTSAFLLPYLVTRTPESQMASNENQTVTLIDLDMVSKVTENRLLGPIFASVGFYSIIWAVFGRWDEFGGFAERYQSFIDLLSIDRVGSSFIVDLIIFALFQGWFVDDDLERRGVQMSEMKELRWLGKAVPFFGMALYLAFRPSYNVQDHDGAL